MFFAISFNLDLVSKSKCFYPSNILKLQCLSICLTNRAGAGQGGQTFSVTGRYLLSHYLLATPIQNKAGQAVIFLAVIF
jgi:hypothetical protein